MRIRKPPRLEYEHAAGLNFLPASGRGVRNRNYTFRQAPKGRSIPAWGNAPGTGPPKISRAVSPSHKSIPSGDCDIIASMRRAYSPFSLVPLISDMDRFLGRCPRLIWSRAFGVRFRSLSTFVSARISSLQSCNFVIRRVLLCPKSWFSRRVSWCASLLRRRRSGPLPGRGRR